ncbi:MAG: RsmD family RNA methyltransferase [Candidatus Latescibacteria bacterium]|jgi:16S rRNA (guanine966-N2)-methyltransferase|nr:RsmD family RNA methyltransferase [Candidatus Latescibacterota bacterium]
MLDQALTPMRIITGHLKGRTIPFSTRKYGNARTTSGRVKEAAFSTLGRDLEGRRFLDLCAGSGQIGLEAWSRGACVVINEPDPARHRLIVGLIESWQLVERMQVHSAPAGCLLAALEAEGTPFDIIYLDPPYEAQVEGAPAACWMLTRLAESPLVSDGCAVMVQHGPRTELPPASGRLAQARQKKHGDTVLTLYRADRPPLTADEPAGSPCGSGP